MVLHTPSLLQMMINYTLENKSAHFFPSNTRLKLSPVSKNNNIYAMDLHIGLFKDRPGTHFLEMENTRLLRHITHISYIRKDRSGMCMQDCSRIGKTTQNTHKISSRNLQNNITGVRKVMTQFPNLVLISSLSTILYCLYAPFASLHWLQLP